MSEWSSEEDDAEAWEVQEREARSRARPLRTIVALEGDGRTIRLDCGHVQRVQVQLAVGDHARCLACYVQGMRQAEQMILKSPLIWTKVGTFWVGIPDDGGSTRHGIRFYLIDIDWPPNRVACWMLRAVKDDGSIEDIDVDLGRVPKEAIERLKAQAEEHYQDVMG